MMEGRDPQVSPDTGAAALSTKDAAQRMSPPGSTQERMVLRSTDRGAGQCHTPSALSPEDCPDTCQRRGTIQQRPSPGLTRAWQPTGVGAERTLGHVHINTHTISRASRQRWEGHFSVNTIYSSRLLTIKQTSCSKTTKIPPLPPSMSFCLLAQHGARHPPQEGSLTSPSVFSVVLWKCAAMTVWSRICL